MEKMLPRIFVNVVRRRYPIGHSWAGQSRTFCKQTTDSEDSGERARRLADQAKASQNLWDYLVPERNIGATHPFFLVLLVLTLSLHFYNQHRDSEEDERLRKLRVSRSYISEVDS